MHEFLLLHDAYFSLYFSLFLLYFSLFLLPTLHVFFCIAYTFTFSLSLSLTLSVAALLFRILPFIHSSEEPKVCSLLHLCSVLSLLSLGFSLHDTYFVFIRLFPSGF
jgi:hypothetical protein